MHALSFRYGQRHAVELDAAARDRRGASGVASTSWSTSTCARSAARRSPPTSTCPRIATSAMATAIPITYVPARNTVFLSFALALGRGARRGRHLHRGQRPRLQRLSRLPARVHRRVRADGQPRHQGGRRGHAPMQIHTPLIAADEGADHPPRPRARRRLRADPQLLRPGRRRARPAGTATACLLRLQGIRARPAWPTRSRYAPEVSRA